MYQPTRNFYHPKGKPRIYTIRHSDGIWWCCKLTDRQGDVVGFGKARKAETAYKAFVRSKSWYSKPHNVRKQIRGRNQSVQTGSDAAPALPSMFLYPKLQIK